MSAWTAAATPPIPVGTYGGLTIEPGVRLFGSAGLDYIVVNRGSQIFAVGTPTSPIIFTSRQSVEGTTGVDFIGQWGGLVILGRANITNCPGAKAAARAAIYGTPACEATVEGTTAALWRQQNTDNSGSLRYVRVQHSGFQILPNHELNGITLAGVGSGTTIDLVQVHNSSDDGIEWFGGTVNAKHIVLTGDDDDSIDTDQGFRGVDPIRHHRAARRRRQPHHRVEHGLEFGDHMPPAAIIPSAAPIPWLPTFTFVVSPCLAAADGITSTPARASASTTASQRPRTPTAPCLDIDNSRTRTAPPVPLRSIFMSCPVVSSGRRRGPGRATIFGAGTNNNTAGGTFTLTNTFVNGANETACLPCLRHAVAMRNCRRRTRPSSRRSPTSARCAMAPTPGGRAGPADWAADRLLITRAVRQRRPISFRYSSRCPT